jgi:hypothetical protein
VRIIPLDFSADRVRDLPGDIQGVSDAPLETAEAFTSRFARTVDLLVNKVLRALDRVELKPPAASIFLFRPKRQFGGRGLNRLRYHTLHLVRPGA